MVYLGENWGARLALDMKCARWEAIANDRSQPLPVKIEAVGEIVSEYAKWWGKGEIKPNWLGMLALIVGMLAFRVFFGNTR